MTKGNVSTVLVSGLANGDNGSAKQDSRTRIMTGGVPYRLPGATRPRLA